MTKKITLESTVKDLKETPTGHDLLKSFIDENDETILANIKDRDFVNTLIIMANYGNESEDNNIKSITKNGGKKQYSTKYIPDLLKTATMMASAILKE